ncbi:MAG: tetratricopeptide repeat protein [Pseudonocardiales bacterium]|nr:tetratricopeptide repeat protein [Pseudonocardiales bacterium]
MPFSTMGEHAPWSDVDEIRREFLGPISQEIGKRLGSSFELVIEDEETSTGNFHRSMFLEAIGADIYIADLTGANANVYLELGVRWALRDGVTILICQRAGDIKFNTSSARVILYDKGPAVLRGAIESVTKAAVDGFEDHTLCDSPVRDGLPLVEISRDELEDLKAQIERLKAEQAEDLVDMAVKLDLEEAVNVLRSAVDRNPVSFIAHFQLGAHLTKSGRYAEAAEVLEKATRLDPLSSQAWQELGVAYSKDGKLDEAAAALEESLNLDSGHYETWSNLGGVRRRKSRRGGWIADWGELQKSLEAYEKAVAHKPNDGYAQFNAALLDLTLTLHEKRDDHAAIERFRKLEHLCRWEVLETPGDGWRRLNLSGTLAVLADKDEAVAEVRRLWQSTPDAAKKSYSDSAIPPLRDLLQTGGLTPGQEDAIKAVIAALESQ